MKRSVLILLLMMSLCPEVAFGQGDSLVVEPKSKAQNKFAVTAKALTGASYSLGFEGFIPISKRWSFEPGIFWEYRNEKNSTGMGWNDEHDFYDFHDKAHFISAPLLFRKRMSKQKRENFVSYFHIGSYIAYGLFGTSWSHRDYFERNYNYDREMYLFLNWPELYDYKEPQYTNTVIDETTTCDAFGPEGAYKRRIDFGINLGFSFLVCKHYEIGTYFECSTSDSGRKRGEVCCSLARNWHRGFSLTLGYQF